MSDPIRTRAAEPTERRGRTTTTTGTRPPTAPAGERMPRHERRYPASRRDLLRRITAQYDEMPGMILTAPQAQQLFGLREDVCERALNVLVDTGVLRRNPDGGYVSARFDSEPRTRNARR